MSIRNLQDGNKKSWLSEFYTQDRAGKRVLKRFATKGKALACEKHLFFAKLTANLG